jgi:hypothetical protein
MSSHFDFHRSKAVSLERVGGGGVEGGNIGVYGNCCEGSEMKRNGEGEKRGTTGRYWMEKAKARSSQKCGSWKVVLIDDWFHHFLLRKVLYFRLRSFFWRFDVNPRSGFEDKGCRGKGHSEIRTVILIQIPPDEIE